MPEAPVRRRYVYYRVAAEDLDGALAAAREGIAQLRASHPALSVELLRRPELDAGLATLMEVHGAGAHGVDAAGAALIEACMAERLARWLRGPRHVETFDLLPA